MRRRGQGTDPELLRWAAAAARYYFLPFRDRAFEYSPLVKGLSTTTDYGATSASSRRPSNGKGRETVGRAHFHFGGPPEPRRAREGESGCPRGNAILGGEAVSFFFSLVCCEVYRHDLAAIVVLCETNAKVGLVVHLGEEVRSLLKKWHLRLVLA